MKEDKELDAILDEIEKAETLELKASISGEAVSRLIEQLKAVPTDSAEALLIANRLLIVALKHSNFILEAQEPIESIAFLLGVLAVVLSLKVNPEKISFGYLMLLNTCITACTFALMEESQNTDETLFGHLNSIQLNLILLYITTVDSWKHLKIDSSMIEFNHVLKIILAEMPDDERLFNGEEIRPQSAIDIAYDSLARLHSAGAISFE